MKRLLSSPPLPRVRTQIGATAWGLATVGSLLLGPGCIFELPQPLDNQDPTTPSGGSDSTEPTETTPPSTGGATPPIEPPPNPGVECPAPLVLCGTECVEEDRCCSPPCTAELNHASGRCVDGTCVPVCEPGWVDCDGDWSNGCELRFDPIGFEGNEADQFGWAEPLRASPLGQSVTIEALQQTAWEPFDMYEIGFPCPPCNDDNKRPDILQPIEPDANDGTKPAPQDLRAGLRMAWNDTSGLWLNLVLIDDDWVTAETHPNPMFEGEGGINPALLDNVEIVWDGDNDMGGGANDHHLFISVDGHKYDLGNSLPPDEKVLVKTEGVGSCRVLTAQLSPGWLAANNGSDGMLSSEDNHFSFLIGVNDYDWPPSGDRPTRQHAVYLVKMRVTDDGSATFDVGGSGKTYFRGSRVIPRLELVEDPPASSSRQ